MLREPRSAGRQGLIQASEGVLRRPARLEAERGRTGLAVWDRRSRRRRREYAVTEANGVLASVWMLQALGFNGIRDKRLSRGRADSGHRAGRCRVPFLISS